MTHDEYKEHESLEVYYLRSIRNILTGWTVVIALSAVLSVLWFMAQTV